ncbi:MAG TPA: condensation domain-containing protein [Nostocaceae cyanobacterium]|nr:condensation domain-containing protein [Nostocaceae cyanobacterium]
MNANRKLGSVEQAMEIMNRYDKYFIVTVSRIRGNLNEEFVRQSLDCLQNRHPRLNSRIIEYLDNLYFETNDTPKIPLRVVKKLHSEQWQEVLETELNQKLDSSQGLARAVLVHIADDENLCYLIITVHHAIALASSVIKLHSELLTYYEQLTLGKPINLDDKLPAIPPIEDLLPPSVKGLRGAISKLCFLLKTMIKTTLHQPESLGFNKSLSSNIQNYNLVVHRQLDQNLTQKIINNCQQNQTTVQGALCAAMMLATAQLINSDSAKNLRVLCHSSIDIRKYLEPIISDEHLVAAFSYSTGFFNVNINTPFWELACQVKQQIQTSLLNRQELFSKVLTYKPMTDICLQNPHSIPDSVAVTNIGKLNIPQNYNSSAIEEISFVPTQSMINNNLTVAVTTFNEKMILNFIFSEPTITRQRMEKFVNYVLTFLIDACQLEEDRSQTFTERNRSETEGKKVNFTGV